MGNANKKQIKTVNIYENAIISKNDKFKKQSTYENLVFSGGGIKGLAYAGALVELEEQNILQNIKNYAGTSAGSICAALLAIGYTATELHDIMNTIDFAKFKDDDPGIIRDLIKFAYKWGFCPGAYSYDLFGDLIEKKTGNRDYTIKQLYDDTGKILVIVGTNISTKTQIYFNPMHKIKEYSEIPINKAIRISMSIPFLFEPYQYNNYLWIDGGVIDNYALNIFDDLEEIGSKNAILNLCSPNYKTLGLRIISTGYIIDYDDSIYEKYSNILDFGIGIIETFMINNDRKQMTDFYNERTIEIQTPNFDLVKFSLSDSEKLLLLRQGEETIKEYFK